MQIYPAVKWARYWYREQQGGTSKNKQKKTLLVKEARHRRLFIIESCLHEVSRKGSCRWLRQISGHLGAGVETDCIWASGRKGLFRAGWWWWSRTGSWCWSHSCVKLTAIWFRLLRHVSAYTECPGIPGTDSRLIRLLGLCWCRGRPRALTWFLELKEEDPRSQF